MTKIVILTKAQRTELSDSLEFCISLLIPIVGVRPVLQALSEIEEQVYETEAPIFKLGLRRVLCKGFPSA